MPAGPAAQPPLLAAPDKLKGTLGAAAVAAALAQAARDAGWSADQCPLSDGGEGFAEVLACLGGEERRAVVTGPLGRPVEAAWRLAGYRAVVESAAASGLVLAGGAEGDDPLGATSRGTGELVVAAARAGARQVLVGVGGSAMTDGGSGAVAAVEEAGGLPGVEIVVACDVAARFVEAADLFGPQKGAGPEQVVELRRRLEALAGDYRRRFGIDVSAMPGAGAAGGLAGGLAALGARLVQGFELVSGMVGLPAKVAEAGLVVTAEGRLDVSSFTGKVVGGVAALARDAGRPVLAVVGGSDPAAGGEARRRGIDVLDLSQLVGERQARSDPAGCIVAVVGEALRRRYPPPATGGS